MAADCVSEGLVTQADKDGVNTASLTSDRQKECVIFVKCYNHGVSNIS